MSKLVTVIVGSLRAESYNRKLACTLTELAPEGLEFSFVRTGELPLYNPDLDDGTPPEAWQAFRRCVGRSDAILFVTPEYNRSLPANLKNALDVGSRPMGESVWDGKPSAIVTGSPAASAASGPTTTCGRASCSSTPRRCSSPRPISATSPRCSTKTAG